MELRAYQEGRAKKLAGYAATYNRLSKTIPSLKFGYFREKILPGAFDGVVRSGCADGCECKSCSIVATINHDTNQIIGRVGAGTLKLTPDDKGLRFVITLPDTTYANDLYENVRAGNMGGCSFAFSSDDIDDEWNNREAGEGNEISTGAFDEGRGLLDKAKSAIKSLLVRTIKKFRALKDIAIVGDPAYTGTSVSARSLAAAVELRSRLGYTEPTLEDRLQEFCVARGLKRFDFTYDSTSATGFVYNGPDATSFRRSPGLAEDAPRRAKLLSNAIEADRERILDGKGLVDIILEARKLVAKRELNTIEHRRFWFCVDAIVDLKRGQQLANLETRYRNALIAQLGETPSSAQIQKDWQNFLN